MAAQSSNQNIVAPSTQPENKRAKSDSLIPEDVIENILSFLPLKELTGLSVVSKRFRHSWKFCRDLSFDRNFARNKTRDVYRGIVNNFFQSHLNTCADRFKLYYDATDQMNLVSFWIHRAVDMGVKELEIDLSPSRKNFMLGYDFVDAESIRILKLVNCEIPLQFSSKGLRNLREITVQNVRALPITVEAVFSNCVFLRGMKLIRCHSIYSLKASAQGLRTLVVKDCSDVDSIAINAPSLRTFHYHGKMTEFNYYCDLPHLRDVILDIAQPRSFQVLSHMKDMVKSLAFVETLTVSSAFLEGLSARFEDNEYKRVEFLLWKLKEFHLVVAPESFINPSDVIIFLNKCPRLERVFIDLGLNALGNSPYWENYGKHYLNEVQIVFSSLKYVKIKGFMMKELQVSMAQYFLKNAINLQSLILVKARTHHFPAFYGPECLRWGIISNARVEIYEYNKDKTIILSEHLRGV